MLFPSVLFFYLFLVYIHVWYKSTCLHFVLQLLSFFPFIHSFISFIYLFISHLFRAVRTLLMSFVRGFGNIPHFVPETSTKNPFFSKSLHKASLTLHVEYSLQRHRRRRR